MVAVAVALAASGCLQSNTSRCGDAVCPPRQVCAPSGDSCVLPEQLEACEGTDLNTADCGTFGYYGGSLACTKFCQFDTTGCVGRCGDHTADPTHGEQCDKPDLGGADCTTFGFYDVAGLDCNGGCGYD